MKFKTKITLCATVMFAVLVLWQVCCMRCAYKDKPITGDSEPTDFMLLLPPSESLKEIRKTHSKPESPVPIDRKFVKFVYRLEKVFETTLVASCYTGYDPGDPGHGKYANDDLNLPRNERRIKRHHTTVALPRQYHKQHEELIQLPSGTTHRWRVHVEGINAPDITRDTDRHYFCVPRDRLNRTDRIDYLITCAGKYATIKQRIRNWKNLNRRCEFWEWRKYKLFDDGLLERVE